MRWEAQRKDWRDSRLGTFGAASPVRRIHPVTGLPMDAALPPVAVAEKKASDLQSLQVATNETKRASGGGCRNNISAKWR